MAELADHPATPEGESPAPVLIWLPRGRDAALTATILQDAGVNCATFQGPPETFGETLERRTGPLLIDEAALTTPVVATLREWLEQQPVWSDPPIIRICARQAPAKVADFLSMRHMTTSVWRPVSAAGLVSVVRSAVQAHRRQFQVRDLLAELERLNQQLRRRQDERERLASALTAAERRERERIAGVLHDSLQQLLVGASFQLQRLRWGRLEDAEATIDKALDTLRQSTELCRTLTAELHPPGLLDAPLEDVMGWLADHLRARQGLDVSIRVAVGVETSDPAVRVMLFEAARELLFNVAKHAGVDEATAEVAPGADGTMRLVVEDAGAGAEPAMFESAPSRGMGLLALRERIGQLGGGMEIDSGPGRGCRVQVTLPLQPTRAERQDR